jgi:hypothetical protein
MDDVAEEEPDPEMREHQPGRLLPVRVIARLISGLWNGFSHGSDTFPKSGPQTGPM